MERRKRLRVLTGQRARRFAPISFAVLVACFSSGMLPAQAATSGCIAVPPGLVSWWPGDSNENDIVGSNNPNAIVNVTLVPGEVSDGFSFGTKGYIQIPSSPTLANQTFTWTAWVRPDGPGPNNDIYGSDILSNNINDVTDSVALSWSSENNRFVFTFGDIDSTSGYVTSMDTFAPGRFYLVAATYDGSVFRLFVNGVLEASFAQTKTIAYSNSGWTFGSISPVYFSAPYSGVYTRTWNGVIDEIQAFNTALSASELLSIYNAGSGGECKGSNASSFVPLTPCRVVDTRNASGALGGPSITGGSSRDFPIPNGSCGIPYNASAYSLNVTVVPQGPLGYLTIWPTGQPQPLASTLNSDGRIKANAAIVPAGSSGAVSVFATDTTDLVLDINGYFVPEGSSGALALYTLTPCRIADTRDSPGALARRTESDGQQLPDVSHSHQRL